MIKFGTDGWRAILGEDFTDKNVERTTLAIGKYVYETYGFDKLIIIGYDPRNKADYYAKRCAEILAKKGFTVKLYNTAGQMIDEKATSNAFRFSVGQNTTLSINRY